MRTRGSATDSSWKLESSSTTQCSGVISSSRSRTVSPMFPPTRTGREPWRSTSPVSAVVVVLPLVPVMPTIGAGHSWKKRSISLETRSPWVRAASSSGSSQGTPGLA